MWGWITWVVVLAVWVVVALVVGVLIGRAVRNRDLQVPRDAPDRLPAPRPVAGPAAPDSPDALLNQPPERAT